MLNKDNPIFPHYLDSTLMTLRQICTRLARILCIYTTLCIYADDVVLSSKSWVGVVQTWLLDKLYDEYLLVYNIYVASAGRHAHMGNSEDFGEPAAPCLPCQPSSIISQTCCSRNAKKTKKIIQKAKKSGGRGKSTMMEWAQDNLLWHHP